MAESVSFFKRDSGDFVINPFYAFMILAKDKYEKAKKDIIEAMKSFRDLTDSQQQQLVKEFLGYETFLKLCSLINNCK